MYYWEYTLLELARNLNLRKEQILNILSKYPEGSLVHHRKNGKPEQLYINLYDSKKTSRKYLSKKKDKALIASLEKKQKERPALIHELHHIKVIMDRLVPLSRKIINDINNTNTTNNYSPCPSENTNYTEGLRFITARGEKVRSKSEKLIADLLFTYKLNYKYEKRLVLNGRDYYPDFTIINPLSGQPCYWEHLGLTDTEYKEKWSLKEKAYRNHSILKDVNLIVSTEEDLNRLDEIISNQFTAARYISFIL